MNEPVKYCKICSIMKPITNFYKTKNSKAYPDCRINWCKECMKSYKMKKKVITEKPVYKVVNGDFTITFD